MKVSTLTRVFVDGGRRLPDPGPELAPEDVLNHYRDVLPHLAAAVVEGPEYNDANEEVYIFSAAAAKTKG